MHINSINSISFMPKIGISKKSSNYSSIPVATSLETDSISFSGRFQPVKLNVTVEKALEVGKSLSTSTSGHRAPYLSENFTPDIVKLISIGVARTAQMHASDQRKTSSYVLIGGDTRRASRESLPLIKDTILKQGSNVIEIKDPVPTPLLALATRELNADLGVLMTASHNPWADGGYNVVTNNGAIAPATVTSEIAGQMKDFMKGCGMTEDVSPNTTVLGLDPFNMYVEELDRNGLINWDKIKESGLVVYYDGLQGTGTYTVPRLLQEKGINFINVESKGQEGPNPTDANLGELKSRLALSDDKLKIGLANDGDADRFGVVDEKGNFINANDVILLTGYHLAKNKGRTGAVIRSQATSMQLDRLADIYGLKKFETPVGFKYIAEEIEELRRNGEDILVAGEESGGLTVNDHIPEKDGIIAISLMMDLVAAEGKPISEILKNVKEELGVAFSINNFSKKYKENPEKMDIVMAKVENMYNDAMNGKTKIGSSHEIDAEKTAELRARMEAQRKGGDGYKFILTDGSSVLLRKSGTEPLVKCYVEATGENSEAAKNNSDILAAQMSEFMTV
ncbi:MAG: hypothetical protein MJ230_06320 [bacterium]|nr:hypothetical protein [bacterium]